MYHSAKAWATIEDLFGSQTRAHTINLRIVLTTTHKGTMSIIEYVSKMKNLGDDMAVAG
jgi:hypothetical protein